MSKHESLLNEAHALLKEVYKYLQTDEGRAQLTGKVCNQLREIEVLTKPKLEITKGKWYESDNGIVIRCVSYDPNYVFGERGSYVAINRLVREVKVSPVEE